jgi:isoamylase
MVLDCLRYWAAEYHIDGFRFDLAAILGRDRNGAPLPNPPLLESLAYDPVLAKCKLIAEAWDAGGLYQVGTFPAYGRWAEWNGKYRDALRRFLKGDPGMVGEMALRIAGSPDLYATRGPTASVNFITAHDGFTLHDLVSYDDKHNHANGEDNRDGANDNESWNCGVEGPTDDPAVLALRARQMRNALTILMVSQGVPMLLMGDEMARTQRGNNNTYCHDNDLNWLDWGLTEQHADLWRYAQRLLAFRAAHPVLRNRWHHGFRDTVGSGVPDLGWHGRRAGDPDWRVESRQLAFLLDGAHARGGAESGDSVYVAMNMHWEAHGFELPYAGANRRWHVAFNTALPTPDDAHAFGAEPPLPDTDHILVGERSVVVLIARHHP